jgi:hypothetical protein
MKTGTLFLIIGGCAALAIGGILSTLLSNTQVVRIGHFKSVHLSLSLSMNARRFRFSWRCNIQAPIAQITNTHKIIVGVEIIDSSSR